MTNSKFEPLYSNSHALIIGINNYQQVPPLGYAVSDAEAISKLLQERFDFPPENVHLLLDEEATHTKILQQYFSYVEDGTNINDRVFVFFAGHGYTITSRRGEVGFLVPYDGKVKDISTLIRWDELTRNANLITAKHILFVMDACYGGLAITRSLQPGSMRFLKDMLLRYSRQVITAGKADEVVADLGGPLPDHSIFTGHLLEALSGKSADEDGLITANGVMTYVYRMVGHDLQSQQTPHFGYLDGDGDFIFDAPILNSLKKEEGKDNDVLVSIPAIFGGETHMEPITLVEQVKELLSEPRYQIKLHDLVVQKTREAISLTSVNHFPVQGNWSTDEFLDRLKKYEIVISDIEAIYILIAFWGNGNHREILKLPASRLAGQLGRESGNSGLISLRWYPILLLIYSAGISAVAGNKYENLYTLFHTDILDPSGEQNNLLLALYEGLENVVNAFKLIPEHDRLYVPRSEYLFKLLQPLLDDLIFTGSGYEPSFDQFEVLLALEYAHVFSKKWNRLWGPIGRFGWKYSCRIEESNPLHQIIKQAELQGNSWLPIKAGFFDGSIERFKEISLGYSSLVARQGWN